MDLLHAGAYSGTAPSGDDEVPASELQGHYLDQAPTSKPNTTFNDSSSDESNGSDGEYRDSFAPEPEVNLSKRTEIEEADRIVLPSILTSDEKLDWTLRFVSVSRELRRTEPYPYLTRTLLKLAALERDFLQTAKLYAKIIIDEKFLPNEKKTIKPVHMGGIAGGLKYFQEGILFKFALDSHGLYGGDINAMKSAGHEMKCLVSLFKRLKHDYFVPMVGVIDYKGFRIIAISLLPIKGSTLVYGSNDGGRTFNSSEPVVNNDMNELGASLNLQAHKAPGGPSIRTPADLEVHKGTDGLFYLVDVARLWPPEPPSVKGSFLYRLLREEFVTTYKKPLSADAFSGFANSDPKSKEYNADIREAFDFYIKQFVPAVAQELHNMPSGTDLETYLHSRGINFRHMGLLWQHLPQFSPWRRVVMSEIVTRAAKSVLRSLMRRSIEKFGVHNNEPFLKLIASFFNLLLGTSEDSTAYWHNELFRTVRDSFFYISKTDEELDDKVRLRELIDDQTVFDKLLRVFGVQLKESFWKSFSFQLVFNQPTFVEDSDIEFIAPVIKRSDLGRYALPIHSLDKAECKIKSDETAKEQKRALTLLLDNSSSNYGNVFLTFRYVCRALIVQPVDVALTNLPRLCNLTNAIWRLLETSEEDYELNLKYFLQDLGSFLMFLYVNPPKIQYTTQMTTCIHDIFNPYFIAISFSKNKDGLKKRSVLSEDLFQDIEELDVASTMSFWPELFSNTLAKLPNLKSVNFSQGLITEATLRALNETNLKLEKIVLPNNRGSVGVPQYKELMVAHPHLKHIKLEVTNGSTDLLASMNQENLEHLECYIRTIATTGDVDASTVNWLKQRKNLKKLRVLHMNVRGDITSKLMSAMPQIEELALTAFSSGSMMLEPLEPVMDLKNLTRLDLSGNEVKQKNVTINAPLKLKYLKVKRVQQWSPTVLATVIKNCPDLEYLSARQSVFNDECCSALLSCPKLEVLCVKEAAVTAEGMKLIGHCKSLKHLTLGDRERAISDDAIAHLLPILPNLEVLDLVLFETLSDSSVNTILTTCKKLRKLKLPPTVTDNGFHAKNHNSRQTLTYLNILTSKVTDVGMEMIINNYPNMKILKAPWNITINTFKRFHKWSDLQRVIIHNTIPDLQLNLTAWSLSINTQNEGKIVFAELLPRQSHVPGVTLVGCLGGTTLAFPSTTAITVKLVAKLLQIDL